MQFYAIKRGAIRNIISRLAIAKKISFTFDTDLQEGRLGSAHW